MNFADTISSLLSNNNPIAQQLAGKIKNINDAFAAREISADEAKDLLNDIDVETQLIQLANDLETKILVQQAVSILLNILENIPGI